MRKDAGVSLIAVLVSLVLLSIGILALSRAGGQVMQAHSGATLRNNALAVARAHMETVRSQDPETLTSESAVTVNGEGMVDAGGSFTRTVIVDSVSHNLRQVRVRVTWPRANAPVELVTLAFFSSE